MNKMMVIRTLHFTQFSTKVLLTYTSVIGKTYSIFTGWVTDNYSKNNEIQILVTKFNISIYLQSAHELYILPGKANSKLYGRSSEIQLDMQRLIENVTFPTSCM